MKDKLRPLKDSVVALTGASSGIGRATARVLADAGCHVAIAARRKEVLDQLAAELGDHALVCPTDVRSPEEVRRMVSAVVDSYGRLDSMVIAAGIGAYGGILDYTDEELGEMIETNLAGTVWAVRAALPTMLSNGGGDIVVIASVAGFRGGAMEAVYAATKSAQVGLAGSLDRELRPHGVRVTTICPAAVRTEFAMGRGRSPGMPELASMLQPEDVAFAVRTVLEQPRRMRTQHWSMWSMDEPS
jgi:NADP-dependent 3-hydroxy acid dehydrogenase YdfG